MYNGTYLELLSTYIKMVKLRKEKKNSGGNFMPAMHSSCHNRSNAVHFTSSGGQQKNCRGESIKSTTQVFPQMVMGEELFFP